MRDLRTTALPCASGCFGLPPESLYPYVPAKFDDAAPAYCYCFAEAFRSMRYFRLDGANASGKEVLLNVRKCLASRMPSIFGTTVFSSFPLPGEGTEVAYPTPGEEALGGLALVAVGYDDERMIGGDQGALLVRNAWGPTWGEGGYGWLSYKMVTERLAVDFWSLVRPDFVNTDLFN